MSKQRKTRSRVKRGRHWLHDSLLVRFYRKVIIPFFDNQIPTTTSEYEEQLAIFFGTDYREVYELQVTAPCRLSGKYWVDGHSKLINNTYGKRDLWPNQRLWCRFDRRDSPTKITIDVNVGFGIVQTYTLTEQDWNNIKDKVTVLIPIYSTGRSDRNVALIKEHHTRAARSGLGPEIKIKFNIRL